MTHLLVADNCSYARVPMVLQAHGNCSPSQGQWWSRPIIKGTWKNIVFKKCSRYICDSDIEKEHYLIEGARENQLASLPIGIDLDEFKDVQPSGNWLNQKTILYLGRIAEIKGVDILVKAFAMLDRDDTRLVIAGWYWITSVDSANQVTLDRNWTSGDVPNNGTAVIYHSFTMLSAQGLMTRITDGAPSDASTEIDRDGWLILDTSQANGRLYWRANNAWHYVDATAGVSLPADERIDPNGNQIEVGDEVKFICDRVNDDGSFHTIPYKVVK